MSTQSRPTADPGGLPSASDLGFMLGLRRQGIQTSWEHNDLLEALMGGRPPIDTGQDFSKWAFLKDDGSFGNWTPPRNDHEGALFNTVREHEKVLASDYAQAEEQAQTQGQSQYDLEAMATAPQGVLSAPILSDMAQGAQARQTTLQRATGGSEQPRSGMGLPRTPGILARVQRASRVYYDAFARRR